MALDAQEDPHSSQMRFSHKPGLFLPASSCTQVVTAAGWDRGFQLWRQIEPDYWQHLPGPVIPAVTSELSECVFCWRVLVQNHSFPALAQTQQWGRMAISHSSVSSSAVCCFIGIKGQDADWILPDHFSVLFSVLSQIRVFHSNLPSLNIPCSSHLQRISCWYQWACERYTWNVLFFWVSFGLGVFLGFHFFKISCDGTKLVLTPG